MKAETGASTWILYPPPGENDEASEGLAELPASDPRVWGPFCWAWLHTMAAHYPERPSPGTRRACALHLESLPALLPCPRCRTHCRRWLRRHRRDAAQAPHSRAALVRLLVRLHNAVNRRNRKPAMDLAEARRHYRSRYCLVEEEEEEEAPPPPPEERSAEA